MALLTMRDALNQAMREEMARDPSVFILGEEVGAYQGAYKVTQGLLAQFGEWRKEWRFFSSGSTSSARRWRAPGRR